ncbi:MAG: TrmB family transcriptional regulator sugar-binding domain-containing protein [Candidatus Bathyarchaeia archaeon]
MGASSISTLSNALKTNRMNIYRNIKRMQNMGLVNIIPGKPMKFSAAPVTAALDILLSAAKSKVMEMENKYARILEELSRLSNMQQECTVESKFRVHCGRRNVYSVMMQMLENSEREACLLTTPTDLIRMSLYGFCDVLRKLSAKGVRVKILTNVTDKKLSSMLRDYMKYATLKHTEMEVTTRFLIADEKVAFTSLYIDDSMGLESESDSGFWTDSSHYVQSIRALFEVAWRQAQDALVVLWYLKTGKPIEKIMIFSNIEEYHRNLVEMVNRAEREVLICVTQLKEPFITDCFIEALKGAHVRGVNVKVLTSIDEEISSLKSLLEIAEVRHIHNKHIHIDFVTTDLGESLLCLPISFIDENRFQMIYLLSSSIILSTISRDLFMDLWLRSSNSSIRLAEIRFKKVIRELPETLKPIAVERGWLLEMPATVRGRSGLNQKFDIVLRIEKPVKSLIVGGFLPEGSDIMTALISLHIKAIDVGANQKLFIIPNSEWLGLEENKIAVAYNIDLIGGLKAEEISQKIIENVASRVSESI